MNLFLYLAAFIVVVSAAPQRFESQDAEFLPSEIDTGDSSSSPAGSGGFFPPRGVGVQFIPIRTGTSIFDILFGPRRPTDDDITPDGESTPSDGGNGGGGFPSLFSDFFGGSFLPPDVFSSTPTRPRFPAFPEIFNFPDFDNIPPGSDNSTHEVKVINGTRYEVNQTISTDEEGHVFFTQVLVNLTPDTDGSGLDPAEPAVPKETPIEPGIDESLLEADPATNQEELAAPLVRRRRWLLEWFNSLARPENKSNSLPLVSDKESSTEGLREVSAELEDPIRAFPLLESSGERVTPISYVGDTNVNYRGPKLRNNPDAEIFDVDLIRADAERFFASQPQPFRSHPLRSQPRRSRPAGFKAVRSWPSYRTGSDHL